MPRRMLARAWRVLGWAPWLALLAFLVLLALPRVTPLDLLIVRGGSMEPAIPIGSAILIDRGDRTPVVSMIAAFRDPSGSIVTHRIVRIEDGLIATRGDANATEDAVRRSPADLIGVARLSIPFLGYFLYVLQQPVVFLLVLLSTGGVLVLSELRVIGREIGKMRRKPASRTEGQAGAEVIDD